MGHVCHFFSRVFIILTFSLPRLCSLKILVRPKNFVKNCFRATFYLCLIGIFDLRTNSNCTNFFCEKDLFLVIVKKTTFIDSKKYQHLYIVLGDSKKDNTLKKRQQKRQQY